MQVFSAAAESIEARFLKASLDTPMKLDSYWLESFIDILLRQGLYLKPMGDNKYHLITKSSDKKTPYLTFGMHQYSVRFQGQNLPCVAIDGLAPQMEYRNRSVIRTFFECLITCLDQRELPCILRETLTDISSKYTRNFLEEIEFHSKELMNLAGIESNSQWVRMPQYM